MSLNARRGSSGRRPRRKFSPAALWRSGLAEATHGPRTPRLATRGLRVEQLESRTLLSATIAGTVWHDVNGDGLRQAGEPGLSGQTVFLDVNHDGRPDSTVGTFQPTSTAVTAAGAGAIAASGAFGSSLAVQNLPTQVLNVAVSLDVTNASTDPVLVALVSPEALTVPGGQWSYLLTLQAGQHFVGAFDGTSTNSVNGAPSPVPNGTYAPQEGFNNPQVLIDNGNPDGTWALVFFPPSGSPAGLTLNSWSLAVTSPEPSATTDAAGNYAFAGLTAGTYQVGLAHSAADVVTSSGGAVQTVAVGDGQTAGGVTFGVRPAADLAGVSFALAAPATGWGQPVTVRYTLTNQGAGDAGPFDAGLYLSGSGVISAGGPQLGTVHVPGLAAGASTSGAVTVTLPAAPPPGFGSVATAYAGFVLDPAGAVPDADRANNSNQGAGTDLALLGAPASNVAVAAGAGVHQGPSLAVDPTDPSHLISVYLDYSLLHTGYAGVGVAVSHDGGHSWANSSVPLLAGYDQGAAALTVAFDAQGNAYVSFMAATFLGSQPSLTNPNSPQRAFGFQSNNGIFVAESSKATGAGGLSWGQPVAVASNLYAGTPVPFDCYPDMAVDPASGAVYVTWLRFYPAGQYPGDPSSTNGSIVLFAVSRDGGTTFQTQLQNVAGKGPGTGLLSAILDPVFKAADKGAPGRGFMATPSGAVGAGGAVYVSAYAGGYFTVYSSTDAGLSVPTGSGLASGFLAPNLLTLVGTPFDYFGYQVLPLPSLDGFRTVPTREIAADPVHPGVLYAVAANALGASESQGGPAVDANGIVFAVSRDYGRSWSSDFTVGTESAPEAGLNPAQTTTVTRVLNDDNGGVFPGFAAAPQDQVVSTQVLPSIAVNAQGVVSVIWYDTRSDPAGGNVEVWGTVSSDGGRHFSPNFRVSDASFDPTTGAFIDATGNPDGYLGDQIGLATAGDTAYAVWTDTRNGNQQIFLGNYALTPAPQAPADRFGPNDAPQAATSLGTVTAQTVVPRLTLPPGGADEWFSLQAGASGVLSVSATAASGGGNLHLELTDANGNVLPATVTAVVDPVNGVVGTALVAPGVAGQTYLVHVFDNAPSFTTYDLTASVLTADLGTQVQGTKADTLAAGGQDVYRLAAGITGTLQVRLAAGGDVQGAGLSLTVLGADGQTVLASGPAAGAAAGASELVSLAVTAGQTVLLQVSGVDADSAGSFTLQFTNLDQYEVSGIKTLFFPTQGDPTSIVAAKLRGPNQPTDLLVSNTDGVDALGTLAGNGDGTFQAERQFAVGPGLGGTLSAGKRQVVVADLNGDNAPDVVLPNFRSSDVSVLLGNGDGTFQPQRRFNGVNNPDSLVAGKFIAGDHNTDLVVLQQFAQVGNSSFAFLRGRGDGTFYPPVLYRTAFDHGSTALVTGDFNGDGNLDLIIFSVNEPEAQLFLGNGDGTFRDAGLFAVGESTVNAVAVDLTGDGKLDLVTTGQNSGNVYVMLGNGDGTFQPPQAYTAMAPRPGDNVTVNGLAVVDFGSAPAAGSSAAGPADGQLDIVVTAASRSGLGSPEVILLPGLGGGKFGAPVVLATVGTAGPIAAGDFTGDGTTDLAVADKGGVTVVYGKPAAPAPNTSAAAARDLGSVAHLVTLPQAVVTGHEDAFYRYTVPTEAARGSGPEVIDFSALFQDVGGAGLTLEVTDAASGRLLGSGDRFQVLAGQGEVLTLHVRGLPGGGATAPGFGTYTLDVDVLPQVVSVQAEAPVEGGPVTSLVLTFQGDRLDPATAENPANYTVTWLGTDGSKHQVIPVGTATGGQAVVYDGGANLDVATGLTYPTAVRQTVTLLFASPLPAGSYEVSVSPAVQAAPQSAGEAGQLVGGKLTGHPVVSLASGSAVAGVGFVAPGLVPAPGTPNLDSLPQGSPFLTQFQNDLDALLDSLLAQYGDDPNITALINQQIAARFGPAVGAGTTFAVIWLDPVSLDVQSPQGTRDAYSAATNQVSTNLARSFFDVSGSMEIFVMGNGAGTFQLGLGVGDVPALARGGAVLLGPGTAQVVSFTDALRGGTINFVVDVPGPPAPTAEGGGQAVTTTAASSTTVAAGPAVAAQGSATNGSSLARQVTAALVTTFVNGLAVSTTTAPAPGPLGGVAPAAGPNAGPAAATAALVASEGAASGGGTPSTYLDWRRWVDVVLQDWLPAATVQARTTVQVWVGAGMGVVGDAFADLGAALAPLGVDALPGTDLHWQELLGDLGRYGAAAAQAIGTQFRSRAGARIPTAVPVPAAGAGQQTPAPMPEEDDEFLAPEDAPFEAWLPLQLPRRPDPYAALMFFLAGAYQAGRQDATRAAEEQRRRRGAR